MLKVPFLGLIANAVAACVGCTPAEGPAATSPAFMPTTAAVSGPSRSSVAQVTASPTSDLSGGPDMSQTRVRFAVGGTALIVRIVENPTSRDFVSMLTLHFTDFNAMEKMGDLPRRLTTQGSSGSPPANGDLIYFVPWGNLGFFYNAARRDASFDDRVILIGTIETGHHRLSELETSLVHVDLIS
jgi:hypothetical protein